MNQPDFETFALALDEDAFAVLTGKGKDYARGGNAFHNFETTAEFLGLKREEVLAAHLYKHFAAIFAFVREGRTESEPIRSRIIDAKNYLTFLAAMADGRSAAGTPYCPQCDCNHTDLGVCGVDLAPGREIKDTGPPWYLPAGYAPAPKGEPDDAEYRLDTIADALLITNDNPYRDADGWPSNKEN